MRKYTKYLDDLLPFPGALSTGFCSHPMFNRFYLSDDGLMLGFDSEVTAKTTTTTDPIKTDQVEKVKGIEQSVS
jgi:hypothetical protein